MKQEQEQWAYIIESDKVVEFNACTKEEFHINGCPEEWLPTYAKDKYIGSGYVTGYDIYGNMWIFRDVMYFYN